MEIYYLLLVTDKRTLFLKVWINNRIQFKFMGEFISTIATLSDNDVTNTPPHPPQQCLLLQFAVLCHETIINIDSIFVKFSQYLQTQLVYN